jgi:quercetin dioxygenase-like cupin family protein
MSTATPSATLHRWSEVEVEQITPLFTRQFITGSKAMFGRIALTKGCVVPRHSHPNEQIAFILEGSLRFHFDDGTTQLVNSGEMLVIPSDLPHSAEALENTINFDIFAPPRQDWLAKDDSYLR